MAAVKGLTLKDPSTRLAWWPMIERPIARDRRQLDSPPGEQDDAGKGPSGPSCIQLPTVAANLGVVDGSARVTIIKGAGARLS
jgi:hypothetical protein